MVEGGLVEQGRKQPAHTETWKSLFLMCLLVVTNTSLIVGQMLFVGKVVFAVKLVRVFFSSALRRGFQVLLAFHKECIPQGMQMHAKLE